SCRGIPGRYTCLPYTPTVAGPRPLPRPYGSLRLPSRPCSGLRRGTTVVGRVRAEWIGTGYCRGSMAGKYNVPDIRRESIPTQTNPVGVEHSLDILNCDTRHH